MNDVEPRHYTTVIREIVRHENDVTNHRIMWLFISPGLIANAHVGAGSEREDSVSVLAPVGILVTLSTFVILYKSYHARGYLELLGNAAKQGTLRAENPPLLGWPKKRVKSWHEAVWLCPWLREFCDLLEPYFFLPSLLIVAWLFVFLHPWLTASTGSLLVLSSVTTLVMLWLLCVVWVGSQRRDEDAAANPGATEPFHFLDSMPPMFATTSCPTRGRSERSVWGGPPASRGRDGDGSHP